jgi:hypothetical protein
MAKMVEFYGATLTLFTKKTSHNLFFLGHGILKNAVALQPGVASAGAAEGGAIQAC